MLGKISASEARFIEEGVKLNVRSDGRGRNDYRHMIIETGVVPQANGSCRLRLSSTDVLVGVKVEIGEPSLEHPDEGKLQFAVEWCVFALLVFQK